MAKPASKTKKTIWARLGSLAEAGTKGKKTSASSKNIAPPISNRQKKSQGSSSKITYLAAATHDNDNDSIVDQDDHVVLAGVPDHSFLSLQKLQHEIIDDDLDDDNNNSDENDDNNNNNNDNHFGMEYNATFYDERESSAAVVHLSRL